MKILIKNEKKWGGIKEMKKNEKKKKNEEWTACIFETEVVTSR